MSNFAVPISTGRMKICHVLWSFDYGGIETMVANIANIQVSLGNKVTLLVINDIFNEEMSAMLNSGVEVVRLDRPAGSHNPLHIIKLNATLHHIGADVTHFHHVNIARYIFKPMISKWCTTYHTTWRPEMAPYFKDNRRMFAISHEVKRDIAEHAGVESTVVVNGILSQQYKHHVPSDKRPFRILQLGRLNMSIKGQDMLIDAAEELVKRGHDIEVSFIGQGCDEQAIRDQIKCKGLDSRVHLCGVCTQEHLKEHIADYDLLVQPSRIEGFGLTVAEAMAAHVPVVVSNLNALVEVVDGGRCGLIFDLDAPQSCADVIERAINEDLSVMVERAAERVAAVYDVSATAQAYLAEYAKL